MQKLSLVKIPGFLIFLVCWLTAPISLKSQSLRAVDFAKIQLGQEITESCFYFADSANQFTPANLGTIPFSQKIPKDLSKKVSPKLVNKYIYLEFAISNTTDTLLNCYFLPGFYFTNIDLFFLDSVTKKSTLIPQQSPATPIIHDMFSKIPLPAHQTKIIVARLHFIKSTVNTLMPQVSRGYYLPYLITKLQAPSRINSVIAYLVCGILMMMVIYSLAVFWMNGNIEFIYYAGYALAMCVLFFLKALLFREPSHFNYFFESYLDFIIHSAGTLSYILFLRKFTESKYRFPVMDKVFIAEQWITLTGIIIFSYLHFFTDNFVWQNSIENLIKYLWSLSTVFFIIYTLITKSKYLTYLAIGHTLLFISGILSLYLIGSADRFGSTMPYLLNDSLFYYEMGVTAELIFFLAALAFKNRRDLIDRTLERERLKLENERKEFEKQMAVLAAQQDERNRISADMHDELGSGVTAIRLMSEIVKTKMKNDTLPEIDKISASANDLIGKMNTIIWTMKSTNDTVDNLVAYTRSYALEFFENTDINCHFHYPDVIPSLEMNGEKRRNIFLCIKESLNNVVKHSKASDVWINFEIDKKLAITIKDNGVGVNIEKIREFGNGLHNMKKRMEDIEGSFEMLNREGTTTVLSVKIL